MLAEKQFADLSKSMPATVEKAVDEGHPISVISREFNVIPFIEFELIKLSTLVNVDQRLNLQRHQVPVIAQELAINFRSESIEDMSVCFRRGAAGMYGEIYRIDGAVITGWMQKYLEEKYAVIENNLMSEKETFYRVKKSDREEDKPNPERNLLALLKAVIGDDLPKDRSNAKENAYQRHKLETPIKPMTVEQLEARELHFQWIKENHDPRTGHKLETWVSEEQWLKNRTK